ncbi:MAG: hypothetical protein NVS9B1_26230 [Candidatus Dormibacteraceae bacterium]
MRGLLAGLVLLPAAVLQVTLAPRLEVAGAFPNLVLLAVVGWTLLEGAGAGLRWAVAGGLMLDLVAPGPLGLHALALLVAAYGTGLAQRLFDPDPVLLPGVSAALATVAYNLVLIGFAVLSRHPVAMLPVMQLWVAPSALYDAILMPFGFLLLGHVRGWLPPRIAIEW